VGVNAKPTKATALAGLNLALGVTGKRHTRVFMVGLWASLALSTASSCNDRSRRESREVPSPQAAGGSQPAYAVDASLFAEGLEISHKACTLSDGSNTMCIEVRTPAMPETSRPYCRDGFAYGDPVAFSDPEIGTCKEHGHGPEIECVECTPEPKRQTWLIPTVPVDQPAPVDGDKSWQLAGGYGLALDGVPVSHPPPPKRSPLPAVDVCGGHAGPNSDYHYHYVPTLPEGGERSPGCLINDAPSMEHSAMFAYAMDGYPIHGRYEAGGVVPTDLDTCGGHVGKTDEWPDGVYHYHSAAAVDADHSAGPAFLPFIRCFRGAIASSDNPQRRGEGNPPPGSRPPPR